MHKNTPLFYSSTFLGILFRSKLKDDLENFVVISSADGKTWKGIHGYNFIANVREGTQIEFYNKLYEDKMKFNRISAKELEVTVKGDKGDVRNGVH